MITIDVVVNRSTKMLTFLLILLRLEQLININKSVFKVWNTIAVVMQARTIFWNVVSTPFTIIPFSWVPLATRIVTFKRNPTTKALICETLLALY